jgi:hypothetical protein
MNAAGRYVHPLAGVALEQAIFRSMGDAGDTARDLGSALKL